MPTLPNDSNTNFENVRSQRGQPALVNEFLLTIHDVPGSSTGLNDERVQVQIDGVDLSPFKFETEDFAKSAVDLPFASNVNFGPITITFVEKSNYSILRMLTAWKKLIFNDHTTSKSIRGTFNPPAQYFKNATLSALDLHSGKDNTHIPVEFYLKNLFPVSLPDVNYDYGGDDFVRWDVEFALEEIVTIFGEGTQRRASIKNINPAIRNLA